MSHLATNTPPSPQPNSLQRRRRAIEETIATLAELFPQTFIAEKWQQHTPLKIGIDIDLVDRGVLTAGECARVLGRYCCGRRAYQMALAAGGPRFDLDGQPSGEVTVAEQEAAKAAIARMDGAMIERAAAAKAALKAERAAARAAPASKPPAIKLPAPKPTAPKPALQLVPAPADASPKRPIGLADLKRAAQARREHADGPEPPRAA